MSQEQIQTILNHIVSVEDELRKFSEIEKQIKVLETKKKDLKDALAKLMPSADFTTIVGNYRIKALAYEVSSFDKAKFQQDNPGFYDNYVKKISSLKLTISPVKQDG